MKRLIVFILILALLVGCSTQNSINETQSNESTSDNIDTASNDNSKSDSEDSSETDDSDEEIGNKNSLDNDVIAEVFSKSLYPGKGENIEIQFKASNKGLYDVEGFDYRIKISKSGSTVYEYKNKTNNIDKNEIVTIKTLNYEFDALGTYKVELFLDELNTIKELKEENNIDSVTIYVKDQSSSSSSNNDEDGATTIKEVDGCNDSDGGKNYKKLGTCTDENFVNGKKDFCAGDENLAEMFCSPSGLCDIEIKECDGVCRDGVCI